jgi:hypothetical protein
VRRSFGARLLHGLFEPATLVSITLCSLFAVWESRGQPIFDVLLVAGVWLFVGLCVAMRDTHWAQRAQILQIGRELEWATSRHRPLRGNYVELALLIFGLATVGLLVTWQVIAHKAAHINGLPPCTVVRTNDCIATKHGVVVRRWMDRETPTIDVGVDSDVRSIGLNDHGGEDLGSHFPLGEVVTIRYHGSTPLTVTEPDGHRQQTDDDLGGASAALKFMAIFFAALTPVIVLLYWRYQRKWDEALREALAEHYRATGGS